MSSQTVRAPSLDPHLTLRRVERQHALIEHLVRSQEPVTALALAVRLGVATRTVERDVERLVGTGIPIVARRGRGGGFSLVAGPGPYDVRLTVAELTALLASMAALGPTATDSAAGATSALLAALRRGAPTQA